MNGNRHCNAYLQNAWNKYGESNFKFEIIELCTEDKLLKREQIWLDKTKCYDKNIGYNLSKSATKIILNQEQLKQRNQKIAITQIGENNSSAKYTEDKILHVINDMMNPNLSWDEIATRNQIDCGTISAIMSGHNWSYLTKELTFPLRRTVCKLSEGDVLQIIDLLLNGKSDLEISSMFSVTKQTISDIRKKKTWKHLTENIDFTIINNSKRKGGIQLRLPDETVKMIKKDIANGYRNKDISVKYDVNISVVSSIKNNRLYKHVV